MSRQLSSPPCNHTTAPLPGLVLTSSCIQYTYNQSPVAKMLANALEEQSRLHYLIHTLATFETIVWPMLHTNL